MALVAFAAGNALMSTLRLFSSGLNGLEPAVTLSLRSGLEHVPVTVDLEGEVGHLFGDDIGSDTLRFLHVSPVIEKLLHQKLESHQVEHTSWLSLVLDPLSVEQKTLSGLGSVCGSWVSDLSLLALEVSCERLGIDCLVPEPKVLL